jgi:guanosine-3',5'-bis(diphosphate) 3'-pyrophosphohydrolase
MNSSGIAALLSAVEFAARKHKGQRRKDPESTPYINHPITVTEILTRIAGVEDLPTLQAALLHDTIEDTKTTTGELDSLFGQEVRNLVMEVTDDKSLPNAERKRLQIAHAPHLSPRAKLIKLADKIANITDITATAPVPWSPQRKREYLDWAEQVVNQFRGTNAALETLFDTTVAEKRALLTLGSSSEGFRKKRDVRQILLL